MRFPALSRFIRRGKPDKADEVIAVIARVMRENGRDYVWHYIGAIVCLLTIAGSTAFTAWIMKYVVNKVLADHRADLIPLIAGGIFAAFAIRGLAGYGQSVLLSYVGNNLVARYQRRVFAHLMKLGIDFYTETRSGRLAAQINANVGGIAGLLNTTITSVSRDVISVVALTGVMIYQDPLLSSVALLIGPPLIYATNRLVRRMRKMNRGAVYVGARLIGAMQETTQGIAIVKAFTMEKQISQKIDALILEGEERSNKMTRLSEQIGPITEIIAGFAVSGVIAYAGYRAARYNEQPGAFMAFVTALLLAYDPARRLAKVQISIERSLVNARMIYELLDLEPSQGDKPGAKELAVSEGAVRFRNVTFGYTPETTVLHDVSFEASAGKVLAVVGASGAGKSTIVALLQRFYDVDSGAIEIDGQDIAGVTKYSLRHSIAYVSQAPYLFEGSIRDNIRYGREGATDAEIEDAARQANAEEFILRQPQGYDTTVGENGVTLSGGQRQRVSIARAIVRNAPILLLDEATSALDNESEARVQQALDSVSKGRTTIVIAHRLSTVINADKIIVMEAGRLIEEGTHAELINDRTSAYARFHRFQGDKGLALIDDLAKSPQPAQQPPIHAVGGARL